MLTYLGGQAMTLIDWVRSFWRPQIGKPEPDSEAATNTNGAAFQVDRPINSVSEDLFDRAKFAKRIAEVIASRQDSSCLVIGIYGPWGDGKTSTLAMIKEYLASSTDILAIDYNPWFYGASTEAIARAFFESIGDALGNSGWFDKKKIGNMMSTLGGAVPYAGTAIQKAGDIISTEALIKTRNNVGELLKARGKKIVVFIDDIDRLDRTDIQTLFKLVRLSGEFDHTTYVLAFDDAIVSQALNEVYGLGDQTAGRRFLEKIVQIPLHLPPASPHQLRKLMFSACDRVLSENRIDAGENESLELGTNLVQGFTQVLKNPRQVKLFDNAITFAVPLLKNEVRVNDQILLEALRVFYPPVYESLRNNIDYLCASREDHEDEKPSPIDRAINDLISDEMEKKALRALLEELFPRLSNMGYGSEWDEVWAKEKRLCSRDYFRRYFIYAVPKGDMSDSAIDALLVAASTEDEVFVAQSIVRAVEQEAIESLIAKLRYREENIDITAIPVLTKQLSAHASQIPIGRDLFLGDFSIRGAAILISKLAERMTGALQEKTIYDAVEHADSLTVIALIIRYSRMREESRKTFGFLSPEAVFPLVDTLSSRVQKAASSGGLFDAAGSQFGRIVNCIFESGSERARIEFKSFLATALKTDSLNAVRFLRTAAGPVQYGSGLMGTNDFGDEAYSWLATLVDPKNLYAKLLTIYGSELNDAEWVRDFDNRGEVDRRLAHQFAAIHRRATTTLAP